jgi:hypothetical protein
MLLFKYKFLPIAILLLFLSLRLAAQETQCDIWGASAMVISELVDILQNVEN